MVEEEEKQQKKKQEEEEEEGNVGLPVSVGKTTALNPLH